MSSNQTAWPFIRVNGDKPPVVFLHGFLGAKEDWLPVIDVVSKTHECMAPDLPGHGKNVAVKTLPDFDQLIIELDKFRQSLGVERWHLVGYSMGGRIALSYAQKFPAHTLSLIQVSSSPGITDESERAQRRERDESGDREVPFKFFDRRVRS